MSTQGSVFGYLSFQCLSFFTRLVYAYTREILLKGPKEILIAKKLHEAHLKCCKPLEDLARIQGPHK